MRSESSTRFNRLVTISMSASTRSSSSERRSASGVGAAEGGHHEHQAAGLADRRQPGGVSLVGPAQPRRIDHLQGRQGDFLGMVDLAERFHAGLGDGGHGALAGVRQGRVGRHARQPLQQRALARALISHQPIFMSCLLGSEQRASPFVGVWRGVRGLSAGDRVTSRSCQTPPHPALSREGRGKFRPVRPAAVSAAKSPSACSTAWTWGLSRGSRPSRTR